MPLELDTPLASVAGVGPRRAELLLEAGLRTVEDLLWRLPFRYEDRSRLLAVKELAAGVAGTAAAEVTSARVVPTRRRGFSLVEARFADPSGSVRAVFFNQPYVADRLRPGSRYFLYGQAVRRGHLFLELVNPELEPIEAEGHEAVHTGRIVPVYQRIATLGPRAHRALVHRLLGALAGRIPEVLPSHVLEAEGLPGREEALREAHFPSRGDAVTLTRAPSRFVERLAFEELLVEQLGLARGRIETEERANCKQLVVEDAVRQRLREMLPFRLTLAQKRVLQEIVSDLGGSRPMRRLLQGDVGSGKTVVAALAMAITAWNGHQAALMVPTELLADQHARTLGRLLGRAGIEVVALTGGTGRAARRSALARLASGEAQVVVGTHALIQAEVRFKSLALAVIDEQHRFGVAQREALGEKGSAAHLLVMTATPIPRSLALTVYGDLELSVIDQLPAGRAAVRTVIKTAPSEAATYGFVRRQVESGAQAYVVCPLVEESEKSDRKAAEAWAEHVAERYFRGLAVGLVHGRTRERGRLMAAFEAGEVQVLVGTTVIEVGVDIPAASVMVIEHAERFGLSQLHQLRGRIGRGTAASTCFLMVRSTVSAVARARLELVRGTSDGFRIAQADLELRGPGDLSGIRQWGLPSFRIASVLRDFHLLERAREHAGRLAADRDWCKGAEAARLEHVFARGHAGRPGRREGACG